MTDFAAIALGLEKDPKGVDFAPISEREELIPTLQFEMVSPAPEIPQSITPSTLEPAHEAAKEIITAPGEIFSNARREATEFIRGLGLIIAQPLAIAVQTAFRLGAGPPGEADVLTPQEEAQAGAELFIQPPGAEQEFRVPFSGRATEEAALRGELFERRLTTEEVVSSINDLLSTTEFEAVKGVGEFGKELGKVIIDDYKELFARPYHTAKTKPISTLINVSLPLLGAGKVLQGIGKATQLTRLNKAGQILFQAGEAIEPIHLTRSAARGVVSKSEILQSAVRKVSASKTLDDIAARSALGARRIAADVGEIFEGLSPQELESFIPTVEGRLVPIAPGGLRGVEAATSPEFQNAVNAYRTLDEAMQELLAKQFGVTEETFINRSFLPLRGVSGLTEPAIIEGRSAEILTQRGAETLGSPELVGQIATPEIKAGLNEAIGGMGELGIEAPIYFPHVFENKTKTFEIFLNSIRRHRSPLKQAAGFWGFIEDNPKRAMELNLQKYHAYIATEKFMGTILDEFAEPLSRDFSNLKEGYRPFAPDGYLRFYRGEIDLERTVMDRMRQVPFEDALADAINGAMGEATVSERVTAGVAGTQAQQSRQVQALRSQLTEALEARGRTPAEADTFVRQIESAASGMESTERIIERIITEGGVDVDQATRAVMEEFAGMSRGLGKKAFLGATKQVRIYQIPDEVASLLRENFKPVSPFIRVTYDLPLAAWRTSVLSLSPRWILNNIFGNIVLTGLGGVTPISFSKATNPELEKFLARMVPEVTEGGLRRSFESRGQPLGRARELPIGKAAEAVASPFQAIFGPPSQMMLNANSRIEEFYRVAAFNEGLKRGGRRAGIDLRDPLVLREFVDEAAEQEMRSLAGGVPSIEERFTGEVGIVVREAVDFTNEWLFNYLARPPVFRQSIRRAIPFWTFYSNILRLSATLPIKYPGRAQILKGLSELGKDLNNDPDLPRWLKDRIPLNIETDEGQLFLATRGPNPFDVTANVLENPLNVTTPLLTTAIQWSVGRKIFSGQPFTDPRVIKDPVSGKLFRITKGDELEEIERVRPNFFEMLLRNFPQYILMENTIAPFKRYDTVTMLDILAARLEGKAGLEKISRLSRGRPRPINRALEVFQILGANIDPADTRLQRMFNKKLKRRLIKKKVRRLRQIGSE